jgi:hypothetical protein
VEAPRFALAGSLRLSSTGRPAQVEAVRGVSVRVQRYVPSRAARNFLEVIHKDTCTDERKTTDLNVELK